MKTEVGELKRCPRCEENLPLSEFGVCKARPDGLNLYCKRCIREKVSLFRLNLREMKVRKPRIAPKVAAPGSLTPPQLARLLRTFKDPTDRVFEAIKLGAFTQGEIVRASKLSRDEVSDAIANLLLWSRKIRTQMVCGQRMYFVNEPGQVPMREPVRPREPRSYGVSPAYNSIYLSDIYAKEA